MEVTVSDLSLLQGSDAAKEALRESIGEGAGVDVSYVQVQFQLFIPRYSKIFQDIPSILARFGERFQTFCRIWRSRLAAVECVAKDACSLQLRSASPLFSLHPWAPGRQAASK